MKTPIVERIRAIDSMLLVSADRLKRYRASGMSTSALVQRGVIDRQLDKRLELMKERDRA